MDAFYAAVEQRDHPELRGKPIAVGGSKHRGVVASASYEARAFGVRSAMPSITAQRKCPAIIFVKSRFEVYRQVSQQIREIFLSYTDLVEPLSLDEAYLDVTENKLGKKSAIAIAQRIRRDIYVQTGLTASAGISFNKFLAKVASDINKPNGMKVILPGEAEAFLEALPVEKFHGIGRVTADKMRKMGIFTGADLKRQDEMTMIRRFGKAGRHYYRMVRAEDNRPVNPNRIRKSIGAERTFSNDLVKMDEMKERLLLISEKVHEHMRKKQISGKTLTLKIKSSDFKISTRSKTLGQPIRLQREIAQVAFELLEENWSQIDRVRLLGISISNLEGHIPGTGGVQLSFDFDADGQIQDNEPDSNQT